MEINNPSPGSASGPHACRTASGNPFASALLGYPYGGSLNINIASAFQQTYYSFFVHDDWRVSSKLTFNVGLRRDIAINPLQSRVAGLNLPGGLLFTDGVNKIPFQRDLNNWQPRFGAAYRLRDTTVIRGGAGIFYMPTFDTGNSNGFSTSTTYVASNNGGQTPANSLTNPYPVVQQPTGSSLGLATKVFNYSFGIQQQLPANFPEFGSLTQSNNSLGISLYNSLQVSGQKRLSAGLQMRVSFTWNKIMQRTSYLNNQDLFTQLARIQSTEPNRILDVSGSYALPIFAKSGGAVHALLGGWNVNAIVRVSAGYLVNAPTGAFSTGVNPQLSDSTYSRYFNTCTLNTTMRQNCASTTEPAAWITQPAFTLNRFNGSSVLPGIRTRIPATADVSLFKTFALVESVNLQFRAEAFNIANTPAFGAPNTNITSAAFASSHVPKPTIHVSCNLPSS